MIAVSDSKATGSSLETSRLVIFDFDGTLADTLGEALEVVNGLAPRYGFTPVDHELAATLRGLEVREALKRVGLPARKVPSLLLEIRRAMRHRLARVRPVEGIPQALDALRHHGATLGILTSNAEENVREFLERSGLASRFLFVTGSTSLFGKARRLRALLADRSPDQRRQAIYVGDEARDIEAAQRVGIRSAAVLWGAHTRALLEKHDPDWILASPHELLRLCEGDDAAPGASGASEGRDAETHHPAS